MMDCRGMHMDYIKLTADNLESEHICCAISDNKDVQVASKKAWLAERLKEGLVFLKAAARGKCFIEYIPAEYAWYPVEADGYMHVNCFWVSGALKGHGYANDLLNACIADAKAQGKHGITVIASPKKNAVLIRSEISRIQGIPRRGFCRAVFYAVASSVFRKCARAEIQSQGETAGDRAARLYGVLYERLSVYGEVRSDDRSLCQGKGRMFSEYSDRRSGKGAGRSDGVDELRRIL